MVELKESSCSKVKLVKVNHFTLVYIVYYNVWLLALIIYNIHTIKMCINYITLNRLYFFF